jgi:hypothetical protein
MSTTSQRSALTQGDSATSSGWADEAQDEITSQAATRIGDLYAAEEYRQRTERTERIIRRASASAEA